MIEYKPYEYQQYAKEFIKTHNAAGIFLDMGMGKTVITLTAIKELEDVKKVLIIAPLAPAKNTWPQELEKWEHLKGLTYSLVIGNEKQRLKGLSQMAKIYIINRENVAWLVERFKWDYDMVVIDELSSFKSNQAKRFKALKKVRARIKRIVGLTGTPAPKGLMDLWAQIYLLDGGRALGRTLTGYQFEYFWPDKRSSFMIYTWKLKAWAPEAIREKLRGLCISLENTSDLPEIRYINHEIELSKRAMSIYQRLERMTFLPFETGGDIDGVTAASLRLKLLQLAGGAVYDDEGSVRVFHDEKLEMLDELIEEANGQSVLIYYNFKHERDRIQARYKNAVNIKEDRAIERWNRGEIEILLAHPASSGHGLNLQVGGHIVIWFGATDNLEYYMQANKRLHRPGQKHPVLIHHILAKNTWDTVTMSANLLPKEEQQKALLEALRAKIRKKAL